MKLRLLSVTEAGDHDVAICEVTGTGIWDAEGFVVASDKMEATSPPIDQRTALYTGQLRSEGVI